MIWSDEQALAQLRSWKDSEDKPTLIVELAISSLAHVTAIGEVAEVSEDELMLVFGRVAWGSGQIVIPLRRATFTYVTPSDKPTEVPAHNNDRMVGCLELRFSYNDGGCFITEVKPGVSVNIENIGRVVIS